MATNDFGASPVDGPAQHCVLADYSGGDVNLAKVSRGVSISGAGALKVTMVGGETVVIPSGALAAGIIHPIMITKVFQTGSAATGVTVWW